MFRLIERMLTIVLQNLQFLLKSIRDFRSKNKLSRKEKIQLEK